MSCYGNPFHDATCASWTFPTDCWDCGKPIFVYQCTCDSVVLFNDLGPPWPKHDCSDHWIADEKERLLKARDPNSARYRPFEELKGRIRALPSLAATRKRIEDIRTPTQGEERIPTKRMDPMPEEREEFIGVVRDLQLDTPRIRALADLGPIGRALIPGPLTELIQLTVEAGGNPPESFTCVISKARVDGRLLKNCLVGISMVSICEGQTNLWYATGAGVI